MSADYDNGSIQSPSTSLALALNAFIPSVFESEHGSSPHFDLRHDTIAVRLRLAPSQDRPSSIILASTSLCSGEHDEAWPPRLTLYMYLAQAKRKVEREAQIRQKRQGTMLGLDGPALAFQITGWAKAVTKPSLWPGSAQPISAWLGLAHGSRMQQGTAAIAVKKLDEFENPSRKHKAPAKHKQAIMDVANTDADDTDFTASSAEYGSEDPSDATEISNEEVQNILT
ncbi:hypothetical protein F5148DRAFT_1369094 [Russula earlei]|uniref:Uncharacterized protein n=1 Tax=Russula earlei TaxID=71964 RepID=A0ACC0U620_9AGAM|nr:hypothetical protein F5148DRAFT_1369094 [Russula earlei]